MSSRPDPRLPTTRPRQGPWESPLVLSLAGTLAIHVILAVAGDAIVVTHPLLRDPPAPRIELVDVELPPVLAPPPPPIQPIDREPPPPPREVSQPRPAAAREQAKFREAEPPPTEPPPITAPATPPSGGDPVVTLPDVAAGGIGVPVAVGHPTVGHIGRGGSGAGTGSGAGSGSGEPVVAPVSVATIKQRALPRGDYGYFDAGRDYPAEARQLGIEGTIRVRLVVDAHGKVRSSVLLNKLGHGLDELALKRAVAIEFEPARDTDDQPVSSVVVWTFSMTLPK